MKDNNAVATGKTDINQKCLDSTTKLSNHCSKNKTVGCWPNYRSISRGYSLGKKRKKLTLENLVAEKKIPVIKEFRNIKKLLPDKI